VVRDSGSGDRRSRWLGMGPRLVRVGWLAFGRFRLGDEGGARAPIQRFTRLLPCDA
jgi:hypothetical protein